MHASISVPVSLSRLAWQSGSRFAPLAVAVLAGGKAAALAPGLQAEQGEAADTLLSAVPGVWTGLNNRDLFVAGT